MQARDASGRQVSLLNDERATSRPQLQHKRPVSFQTASHILSRPYPAPRSSGSSPHTPELQRSDSYDSQMSNADPLSPMTPNLDYGFLRPAHYPMNQEFDGSNSKRPAYATTARTNSYDEDSSATSPMSDRPGKRYPCRYRESHGCEKTFTTSGHASRHSKIHTAEKAVQCTFSGCQKKFTRADNMKQHLETHFKDKSRSTGGTRTHRAALAEVRRNSTSNRSRSIGRVDGAAWDTEQLPLPTPPMQSPNVSAGTWDMRGPLNGLPILNRPGPSRMPSSGLDALAMAVACQDRRES